MRCRLLRWICFAFPFNGLFALGLLNFRLKKMVTLFIMDDSLRGSFLIIEVQAVNHLR